MPNVCLLVESRSLDVSNFVLSETVRLSYLTEISIFNVTLNKCYWWNTDRIWFQLFSLQIIHINIVWNPLMWIYTNIIVNYLSIHVTHVLVHFNLLTISFLNKITCLGDTHIVKLSIQMIMYFIYWKQHSICWSIYT